MIIDTINHDLKKAMLAGDKPRVEVLKGLKTAIQYLSVSKGVDENPTEDEIINIIKKEQKKRSEAADLYRQAGDEKRTNQELFEKEIIDNYLPASMDEKQINFLVDDAIEKIGGLNNKNMGQVIGLVKQACGPAADGSLIAKIVKERL